MKKTLLLVVLLIAGAGVIAFTATAAASYLGRNNDSVNNTDCRNKPHQTHRLIIKDDTPSTTHISAKRCDVLTITNQDERLRNMSFGVHNQHTAYNGITEKILAKDQSFSVTLTETGSFIVHDHQQEAVGSTFTVSH